MAKNDRVKILLVDDQRSRMVSYEAMLSDLGHELIQARSGPEALQLLMRGDYALVLLDVNMPIMDGFETAQLIHQHPRFEKTPIIFVTAYHLTDLDRLKAYELGAVDYVFLPVIPAILRSKVSVMVELYCKRRELQQLNEHLKQANTELAAANSALQVERTQEQSRFTSTLEKTNAELAQANDILRAEASVRKSVENALRSSEGRLRTILQNTSALIYQMDVEGRFVHVNRMFEQLFHCKNNDVSGRLMHEVFPPDVASTMEANNRSVLAAGQPMEFEEVMLQDGVPHVYTAIKAPLVDEAGNLSGIVGVSTDITERKLLMEALKQADRRKDEFLAVLAHELRNPLAPIVSAVQIMAAKELEDDDLHWCRDVIDRQARHLARLVEDLLDVSRISYGKINLAKELIEISDVIARAIETNKPIIDERDQRLTVELPPGSVTVFGDPTRLAQVVANLLNNAVKYTERGGRIWISVSVDAESERVVIRVKDMGLGIAPELLPQVFELFTQGDHTVTRSQGGLGVGLALVRRLVDLHGGEVSAHSEGAGKGAEFVVKLPISREKVAAPAIQAAPSHTAGRHRVLIVDDNVDSAVGLSLLLKRSGCEVEIAHDGVAGLAAAERFKPAILLLDIGMPEMNGYDLARRIRELSWGDRALLIAMTGWSQEEVRARTVDAGFDVHLIKPVDVDALLRLLEGAPMQRRLLTT